MEGEGPTLALLKFFGNEMHSVKTAANYRGISNQIFFDIVKEIWSSKGDFTIISVQPILHLIWSFLLKMSCFKKRFRYQRVKTNKKLLNIQVIIAFCKHYPTKNWYNPLNWSFFFHFVSRKLFVFRRKSFSNLCSEFDALSNCSIINVFLWY